MKPEPKFKLNRPDYGLLLALILPIFAVMPLLSHAGLPNTADGPVHLMRQVELNQAWQQGNFYPRWGTDLALGHGMPIFSYAPPLLYQLTQLFHLTGLPLDESMKAILVIVFLLYSLGMFLFARRVFGPTPALVAAAVYVYAPYRLREAYIQGNYGQFTGLAFYPIIFWAFHGLITDGRPRYLIAAALSLAGLLLSHNISSMLFAPIFAAYLLFLLVMKWRSSEVAKQRGSEPAKQRVSEAANNHATRNTQHLRLRAVQVYAIRNTQYAIRNTQYATRSTLHAPRFLQPLLRTIAAGLLGLGLAAIFWLPAFGERNQIKLEGITRGFFDFRDNFVDLQEFLAPPLPLDLAAINPEFPLSLGLPQIIAAVLGVLSLVLLIFTRQTGQPTGQIAETARNKSSHNQKLASRNTPHATRLTQHASRLTHTLFFTLFLLLYAFLALPYSQSVWEAAPLLELAEFPWRMLGPAIFCAAFLAAPAVTMIHEQLKMSKKKGLFIINCSLLIAINCSLLIAIALNAYYLYPSQFIPWGTPSPADAFHYEVVSGAIGTTSTGEFLPRQARQHPQPDTLWPDYEAGRSPQKLDPATLPPGATASAISHQAESDTLQINTPQEFVATLRTLYWPGWQLYLNGQPLPFKVTPKTGLIQATIPPGQHTLTLRLESTSARTIGRWLTIFSFVGLVIISIVTLKQRANESASQRVSELTNQPTITPGFFAITAGLLVAVYLLSRPLAPIFTLQSDPNHPQPADQVLQANFDDQLRLVGMDNLPETVQMSRGDTARLTVTIYWRALQKLNTNYSVFLHLDAPNGQTFATVDERHPENIPTRNWPPGLYLRNPLHLTIPVDIPAIRYDLNVGVYDRDSNERLSTSSGETTTFKLGSIWVTGPQPYLSGGEPPAHFGPHITLLQANIPSAKNEPLTLYWQTDHPIDQNYSIFIHLLDGTGNLLGQLDGLPYDGLYPPVNWQPGQIITDRRTLPPLDNLDQLTALAIGIYDPTTGERLRATNHQGDSLPHNSLVIPVTP